MCVNHDGDSGNATLTGTYGYTGGIEHVAVMAPRLTFNQDMLSQVDWGEVTRVAMLTGAISAQTGGLAGFLGGAIGGSLLGVETQPNVDLNELLQTAYDLPIIPGYPAPNVPLY